MSPDLIIDCETTGLSFTTSRIVSIAWIVLDKHRRIDTQYHVIKLDHINPESTNIHGITVEYSQQHGIDIKTCLRKLQKTIHKFKCETLVAHNVHFDYNMLIHEMRRSRFFTLHYTFYHMKKVCTMRLAKTKLNLVKNPKLTNLYEQLTHKKLDNAHNAQIDTEACCVCYKILRC